MKTSGQPIISIVIVSYNNVNHLRALLESIATHVHEPVVELIVVDNASQEPVVQTIGALYPWVKVLANRTNEGFGKACNTGARSASGTYLLFVNSDIQLRGNPVPAMVHTLELEPTVGAVGLTLLNADGSDQPSGFRFPSLWLRILQVTGLKGLLIKLIPSLRTASVGLSPDFVSGAFFLVRKGLFDSIGGFDEDYFMYVEDADLGFRIRKSGHRSVLIPSRDVVHLGQHYEDPHLAFVFRHMNIGQVHFYRKHYGTARLRLLALVSSAAIFVRWCWASVFPASRPHKALFREMFRLYIDTLRGRLPTGRRSA